MKEMKTLTMGGTTYEIVDAKARRAIDVDAKRISAPPITQTASDSVISVNDSAERLLNNLKLFGKTERLEPTPDYPQPVESVENPTVTIRGGNLIPANYADGTHKEMNGVTFDVQPDGSVIVNGTATETAHFSFNTTSNKILMPNGWLSASSGVGTGSGIPHIQNDIYVDGEYVNSVQTYTDSAASKQFYGKVELGASRVKVDAGVTVVSQRIYPMLCAFENPIDYEPPKPIQTMTINRTLPGIGDIRDEIDFERGVYIQRIGVANLHDYVDRCIHTTNETYSSTILRYDFGDVFGTVVKSEMFCNRLPYKYAHGDDIAAVRATECISTHSQNDVVSLFIDGSRLTETNVNGLAAYLAENEVIIYYVKAIPVETPLTEEELAAFDQLYSHSTVTTVYNDHDAEMEIKYISDLAIWAKQFITGTANVSAKIENGVLVIT